MAKLNKTHAQLDVSDAVKISAKGGDLLSKSSQLPHLPKVTKTAAQLLQEKEDQQWLQDVIVSEETPLVAEASSTGDILLASAEIAPTVPAAPATTAVASGAAAPAAATGLGGLGLGTLAAIGGGVALIAASSNSTTSTSTDTTSAVNLGTVTAAVYNAKDAAWDGAITATISNGDLATLTALTKLMMRTFSGQRVSSL